MSSFLQTGFGGGTEALIAPMDPESREDILAIDRQTKEDLRLFHRLYLNQDWESNTVTYTVIEAMLQALYGEITSNGVKVLNSGCDHTFDFYDLLEMGATYRRDESAEKTGNINVKFIPGLGAEKLLEEEPPEGEKKEFVDFRVAYVAEDKDLTHAMHQIDALARKSLNAKRGIVFPYEWEAVATAYMFLRNMYKYIGYKLRNGENKRTMINFNELFEVHGQFGKSGNIEIFIRPGFAAKLIIKSDATTEADD